MPPPASGRGLLTSTRYSLSTMLRGSRSRRSDMAGSGGRRFGEELVRVGCLGRRVLRLGFGFRYGIRFRGGVGLVCGDDLAQCFLVMVRECGDIADRRGPVGRVEDGAVGGEQVG